METARQYYRVDRRQIAWIKFTFEAYEGLAVVTTLDRAAGVIVLAVSPQCEEATRAVMEDLGRGFLVKAIDPPPAGGNI